MAWQNFQDEVMKRFDDQQSLVQTVLINQQTIMASLQAIIGSQQTILANEQSILTSEQSILTKETAMSAELDALTAAVTKIEGTADSTISLVQGLADYIRAHSNDPAAIQAYADELSAKADAMAAAVTSNPVPT